jgi:hypothetical protein
VQTLKEITPGANLWYTRGLTDRWVFAQLQHLLDPDAEAFFRRKEQMQKRKQGNEYFWGPGDAQPKSAPFGRRNSPRSPRPRNRSNEELKDWASLKDEILQSLRSNADAEKVIGSLEKRGAVGL